MRTMPTGPFKDTWQPPRTEKEKLIDRVERIARSTHTTSTELARNANTRAVAGCSQAVSELADVVLALIKKVYPDDQDQAGS